MAKFKGKGVVAASLLVGAASFLSKKENRDKAMDFLNQTKDKVNSNETIQELMSKMPNATTNTANPSAANESVAEESLQDVASTAGHADDSIVEGNKMLDEGGGQTTIDAYNERQHHD